VFATLTVVLLTGCQRPARTFLNDNDQLRRDNLLLEKKVADLEAVLDRRMQQVRVMESRLQRMPAAGPDGDDAEAADIPVLSEVRFGRYSGPVDTNDDGHIDAVRLYVQTRDQKGRFLPTAATAVAQAVLLESDSDPRVLGRRQWTVAQFDAAYRTGILGTHYRLDLPLTDHADAATFAGRTVTVRFTLTDAATGAASDAQQAFDLP
jgi:hypothetical protein